MTFDGNKQAELLIGDNDVGIMDNEKLAERKALGLTIINALVKHLNGTIEIDSLDGTMFRICLSKLRKVI